MAGKSRRSNLSLLPEEQELLERVSRSKKSALREVKRAQILWLYHNGKPIKEIMKAVGMTRKSIGKWIARALEIGVVAALKDKSHGNKPVLSEEGKSWVVHLACTKPKDLGYASEVWTRQALATHVREHAIKEGHSSLARAAKATIQRILDAQALQPHKITYYLERRDPNFESKMRDVLLVYQEVKLQNEKAVNGELSSNVITISVDEKPGVQAIANTAPDLSPVSKKYATIGRDYEYKRRGTCSILAALDLHTGHVLTRVERRHRSREFIALLKLLDSHYPKECTLRLILDNHSSHTSKETQAYLATRPNRFKYIHTPTHGSWLNIVETLFGKMARTFLRHIRVKSWDELRDRILKGIDEINAKPVVHRWSKFDSLVL